MNSSADRFLASIEQLGEIYDVLNERFFESALSKPIITLQPDESGRALG